jgi:threonyl-tRNA synthetase
MMMHVGSQTAVDVSSKTLSKKVREAQLLSFNYQFVVGAAEAKNRVRCRTLWHLKDARCVVCRGVVSMLHCAEPYPPLASPALH